MSKNLILSIVAIAVLALLSLFAVQTFGGQFARLNTELSTSQTNQKVLSVKLTDLQSKEQDVLKVNDSLALALPSTNPGLLVISQLKNEASLNGLVVDKIQIGNELGSQESNLSISINFEATGPYQKVIDFLAKLNNLAPLIRVDQIKLTQAGDVASASIGVFSYWSPFPKTFSAASSELPSLSQEDQKIITTMTGLQAPTFADLAPSSQSGRSNPFEF